MALCRLFFHVGQLYCFELRNRLIKLRRVDSTAVDSGHFHAVEKCKFSSICKQAGKKGIVIAQHNSNPLSDKVQVMPQASMPRYACYPTVYPSPYWCPPSPCFPAYYYFPPSPCYPVYYYWPQVFYYPWVCLC
jgi:hypothetical protein